MQGVNVVQYDQNEPPGNRQSVSGNKSMEAGRGNIYNDKQPNGTFQTFIQTMEAHAGVLGLDNIGIPVYTAQPNGAYQPHQHAMVAHTGLPNGGTRFPAPILQPAGTQSYAEKVHMNNTQDTNEEVTYPDGYGEAKPMFLRERDVYGGDPYHMRWLDRFDIFQSILNTHVVPFENITGIQKMSGRTWRIYVARMVDRVNLLSTGITIKNKHLNLLPENPRTPKFDPELTTRLKVSGVPGSVHDSQIFKAVNAKGCVILDAYREKFRYKNKLTNCDTGDRIIFVEKLQTDIPKFLRVGKYNASLWYYGQPKEESESSTISKCTKCLQEGHLAKDCENDWVCNFCHEEGHKQAECPGFELQDTEDSQYADDETDADAYFTDDGKTEKEKDNNTEVQNDDRSIDPNTTEQGHQKGSRTANVSRKSLHRSPHRSPRRSPRRSSRKSPHRGNRTTDAPRRSPRKSPRRPRSRTRTTSRRGGDRMPRTVDPNALDRLMDNARNKTETPNRLNNNKNSRKNISPLENMVSKRTKDKDKGMTSNKSSC